MLSSLFQKEVQENLQMKWGLGFVGLLSALLAGMHLTSRPQMESGTSAGQPLMTTPLREVGHPGETCEAFGSPSDNPSPGTPTNTSPDTGAITALVQRFLKGREATGQLQA